MGCSGREFLGSNTHVQTFEVSVYPDLCDGSQSIAVLPELPAGHPGRHFSEHYATQQREFTQDDLEGTAAVHCYCSDHIRHSGETLSIV